MKKYFLNQQVFVIPNQFLALTRSIMLSKIGLFNVGDQIYQHEFRKTMEFDCLQEEQFDRLCMQNPYILEDFMIN